MNKEDLNIKKWYKNLINRQSQYPPDEVWENIENQLDVQDVWNRIDDKLSSKEKVYNLERAIYYIAAAVALFFIIRFTVQEETFMAGKEQDVSSQSPIGLTKTDAGSDASEMPLLEGRQVDTDLNVKEQAKAALLTNKNERKTTSKHVETDRRKDIPDKLIPQTAKGFFTSSDVIYNDQLAVVNKKQVARVQQNTTSSRRMYFGITGQIKNTWLFNNTTIRGLKKDELSKTVPDIDKDIAIHAGYQLSDKIDIFAVANFRTYHKQKYYDYMHGNYTAKETLLNYSMLDVQFKYNMKELKGSPYASANFIFGCYAGLLKNAKQKYGNATENVTVGYKNYDIGITLGYEYAIDLFSNMQITPGLRLNQGILNIYNGDENMPAYFNKTYSTAFNFNIGLNYYIN